MTTSFKFPKPMDEQLLVKFGVSPGPQFKPAKAYLCAFKLNSTKLFFIASTN